MNKLAILCVDDEQVMLNSLKKALKRAVDSEYLIETVESAQEGLVAIDELWEEGYEIPIVIADYIMPNMKGDEFLRRVHALSPKTLKIMLTGQATIEGMGNVINHASLYRYMAKPVDLNDFHLTVKEALNSYFQTIKLEQFYADLEEKIVERTRELHDKNHQLNQLNHELNEKNEQLLQLNMEKNEFLGIAAHDLKNPLGTIQSAAELLGTSYDQMPKTKVIRFLDIISISSRQMFELIQNLLDVNALESGKMNLSIAPINILPSLQWLLDSYTQQAKDKDITMQFQYSEKKYRVIVDENAIRQILENLISNAIKYSPRGKNITIRLNQDEKIVRCEIQDEGPGLSDLDKQKLFGKFKRLTAKPTGGEHSTGLGLFIVKKLVTTMNGSVWCESELGQGATFIVEFPRENK